ncbi:MAG: formate--phosphoribosylaminoimidazolecarboxamide ligase family protein [Thaumarchaeota archaeon]|jgi:5-formaminoimidazole-4-carboxamide-1-(beta)-D-ribofuranosyl 5'-monophosphate synthetase|nr:formate--phosphoribosylaminoimidazolecarboxamide ligase family protein [Candidatus Wolframiiraptor allenii]
MISRDEIASIIEGYHRDDLRIGVLGSHSALEICRGARDEGFKTIVVCERGREKTYARYYRVRHIFGREVGVVDEVIILDKFREILRDDVQGELRSRNTIFVPHRSLCVYVGYRALEEDFRVPMFGNRFLLKVEERDVERNQYYLMERAGIPHPRIFKNPSEIDCLVLVKAPEAARGFERAFFLASSPREFEEKAEELIRKGVLTREGLERAVIEEFIVGAPFNFNFFYSPLTGEVELLGVDTRRQTNLEGIMRLPAPYQAEALKYLELKTIEVGHIACTVRESLLERAFELAEKLVEAARKEYPPGIIGPFALQGMIVPGPPHEEIIVYDLSVRVPGSPGTKFTPYSENLWGFSMSVGRRIALEIKESLKQDKLLNLIT